MRKIRMNIIKKYLIPRLIIIGFNKINVYINAILVEIIIIIIFPLLIKVIKTIHLMILIEIFAKNA